MCQAPGQLLNRVIRLNLYHSASEVGTGPCPTEKGAGAGQAKKLAQVKWPDLGSGRPSWGCGFCLEEVAALEESLFSLCSLLLSCMLFSDHVIFKRNAFIMSLAYIHRI